MSKNTASQHDTSLHSLQPNSSATRRLFLLGFFTLFLELALIRYLPSNIWNLGYFPNLVLLGVFVGMGVGFIFHSFLDDSTSSKFFAWIPHGLLTFIVVLMALRPEVPGFKDGMGELGKELYFTTTTYEGSGSSNALFLLWFGGIVLLFAMISQATAKLFTQLSPLRAYTADIAGSCLGILTFILISAIHAPAWTWFLVLIPLFLSISEAAALKRALGTAALLALVGLVYAQDSTWLQQFKGYTELSEFIWSPYQRVKYKAGTIFVNQIAHQAIVPPAEIPKAFYQLPYNDRKSHPELPPYQSVLIIGAGSGNDVLAGLLNQVSEIDAVEIDPAIVEFGKKHHPGHPYSDQRVRLTIDDGRAFLTRTQRHYDLVILALTDSLVKVSAMSQLRLENFLFTTQTVQRAYELLNPNGTLVFYNYYRSDWLIQKLQDLMVLGTGGEKPRVLLKDGDFAVMVATKSPQPPVLAEAERQRLLQADLPTDDWPFLYLQSRELPTYYLEILGAFTVLILGGLFGLEKLRERKEKRLRTLSAHSLYLKSGFVFMGIAFLLLETKSVIQFSLLFGTTWLNSSLVFLGILVSVLAANLCATLLEKLKLPVGVTSGFTFALLIGACAASWYFPTARLLYAEDKILRFVLASLLTFSPLFFANLIFSVSFQKQKNAENLFGWNMMGATLGGVMEYSSTFLGYQSLTLLVGVCYAVAFVFLILGQEDQEKVAKEEALAVNAP